MAENKKDGPEKLYHLLSLMATDLERLYNCLLAQQHALVKCRLDDLNKTLKMEHRLVERNIQRDGQYQQLIAEMLGGKAGIIPLKELAETLEPPWPERFAEIAQRLRGTGRMIGTMRKHNEFLITRARELVNERLKFLLELAQKHRSTYEENGRKKKKSKLTGVFDRKL